MDNKKINTDLYQAKEKIDCVGEAFTQDFFFTDNHFYKGKIPRNIAQDHDDYL